MIYILLFFAAVCFGRSFYFVTPRDGQILKNDMQYVAIKGSGGDSLRLVIEGDRIYGGKLRSDNMAEFFGVKLPGGRSSIVLEILTQRGWLRGDSISVIVPGNAADMKLSIRPDVFFADGTSKGMLSVELLDRDGMVAPVAMPVTIEIQRARMTGDDREPNTPGFQTMIENGKGKFTFQVGDDAGDLTARVTVSNLERTITVPLNTHLRPMIMVGHIGGELGWQENNTDEPTGTSFDDEGTWYDGRGAFFARGALFNKYLLTASYDSKVIRRSTMFRQTDPEELLPIYGDTGSLFFLNRASTPLYLRLEKNLSFIEWSDFKTELDPKAEYLQYNRTLTGVNAALCTDNIDMRFFVSPYISGFGQIPHVGVTDTIMPDGTSGFYRLNNVNIVRNSESIRIETRDRYSPEIVIDTDDMQRFTDYDIDYEEGLILFTSSVQSHDAFRNIRVIIVDYEINADIESAAAYGGRFAVHPGEIVEIGATGIRQEINDDGYTLLGGSAKLNFSDNAIFLAEVGHSDIQDSTGSVDGTAFKLNLDLNIDKVTGNLYYRNQGEGFTNSSLVTGITSSNKVGTDLTYAEGPIKGRLTGYYITTADAAKSARTALEGSYQLDLFTFSAGVEYMFTDFAERVSNTHGLLRVDWQVLEKLSLNVRRQQPFDKSTIRPTETALGADWNVWRNNVLYGSIGLQQYKDNTRDQQFATIGIKSNTKGIKTRGEYRVNSAGDQFNSTALIGLSDRIRLVDWAYMDVGLEDERAIEENEGHTSVSLGLSFKPQGWLITTKGEFSNHQDDHKSLLGTAGISTNLMPGFSMLLKEELHMENADGNFNMSNTDYIRNRALLGFALRPVTNDRFNALFKLEYRYDQNLDFSPPTKEQKLIFSFQDVLALGRHFEFETRYAAKHVMQKFELDLGDMEWDDIDPVVAYTDVKQARITWEFTHRMDIGVEGRWFSQYQAHDHLFDFAPEFGWVVFRNVRLGVGYNYYGYYEDDLGDNVSWRRGPYVTLDLKLNERGLKVPVIDYDPEMEIDHATIMQMDQLQTKPNTTLPQSWAPLDLSDETAESTPRLREIPQSDMQPIQVQPANNDPSTPTVKTIDVQTIPDNMIIKPTGDEYLPADKFVPVGDGYISVDDYLRLQQQGWRPAPAAPDTGYIEDGRQESFVAPYREGYEPMIDTRAVELNPLAPDYGHRGLVVQPGDTATAKPVSTPQIIAVPDQTGTTGRPISSPRDAATPEFPGNPGDVVPPGAPEYDTPPISVENTSETPDTVNILDDVPFQGDAGL